MSNSDEIYITMKKSIKKLTITGISLFSILIFSMLVFVWYSQRKISLIDLQKKILIAKTEIERQRILERLDEYYLKLSIPDSIRQHVQAEVDTLIRDYEKRKLLENIDVDLDTNFYQLEVQLKKLLRDAMIARVRGEKDIFQSIIKHAEIMAQKIDEGAENNYWVPWVQKVENFSTNTAITWLSADRAERLCKRYHLSTEKYRDSERYGALGLKFLNECEDARLRLDIMQRLVTTLYQLRGMYDLCYPISQRESQKADELKYHLRATGILFHYASALWLAGRNQSALDSFLKIIDRAERNNNVPYIAWYERSARLGIAKANWELGNYKDAISICNAVETSNLEYRQEIDLYMTRGIAYRGLGNYDRAEEEYHKALNVANCMGDISNQIIALKNLGMLYYRLTDYDMANYYYCEAMKLLQECNPNNYEERSKLLMCLAENEAARGEIENFNHLLQEASKLIKFINLTTVKSEILRSLGRLNMSFQKHRQAYDYLRQAASLYEDYGLLRAALETKNNLIECLVGLSKYEEAKELLHNVYLLAKKIHDVQRKIEAIGMMAEIARKEGDINEAIQISNQLIKEIEFVTIQIMDFKNLVSFRQKIHQYLQNAVIYELSKGRIDSAFIKLDYIKARALKGSSDLNPMNRINNGAASDSNYIERIMAQLDEKKLVIDYFVTQDTLYAFILDRKRLKLLKKQIHIEVLRDLSNSYIDLIDHTVDVYQNRKPAAIAAHYDSITVLSQNLYKILLGWPELHSSLQNTEITYIIPDDFLHRIPFSCLMVSGKKNPKFLVHQTAIVNLPSVAFLNIRNRKCKINDIYHKKVLISADRSITGGDDLVTFIKQRFTSAEELIIDSPVIEKKEILAKLNEGYDIYVFFGHSVCNVRIPDSSFLKLNLIGHDNSFIRPVKIYLAEFQSIDWSKAKIVFLIGCETAKGKSYRGTGLASIQYGLLTAGAQEVLASLWRIDAVQATRQIINFLKTWNQNRHSALALRDVQIKTIQDLQSDSCYKKPHPYIWGGLTLSQVSFN